MSVNVTVVINENPVSVTASPVNAIINVSTDTFASARAVQAAAEAEAAALQTAADRVQTGIDVIATNADSIATAADRVQTGLDRIATQAAKDEIVDKVIFTPANDEDVLTFVAASNKFEPRPSSGGGSGLPIGTEGDIIRYDNTNTGVVLNETTFLQSKVPFEKSIIAPNEVPDSVFLYDTFHRANGALLTPDFGVDWQFSGGTAHTVDSRKLRATSLATLGYVTRTPIGFANVFDGVGFEVTAQGRGTTNFIQIIIGTDLDNYYFIDFERKIIFFYPISKHFGKPFWR
jgi:hypothetical protein